jgi:ketosteroid isomerase-like protein
MSQENVEIVRALFEVWNAADMDAFRELYDPDVIVRTVKDWPEPGPYVGREAAMRFHEQLRDTWDVNTLVPISDFIDAGDRVAVRYIWRGAGHGPDVNMELTLVFTMRKGRIFYQEYFWNHAEALDQRIFQLFTLRRGLVVRQDDFQDHADALEAAGMSE